MSGSMIVDRVIIIFAFDFCALIYYNIYLIMRILCFLGILDYCFKRGVCYV